MPKQTCGCWSALAVFILAAWHSALCIIDGDLPSSVVFVATEPVSWAIKIPVPNVEDLAPELGLAVNPASQGDIYTRSDLRC